MQLVEEAVDGCWIGHRARTAIMEDTGIGSVYSPPKEDESKSRKHIEAVIDIGERREVCKLRRLYGIDAESLWTSRVGCSSAKRVELGGF